MTATLFSLSLLVWTAAVPAHGAPVGRADLERVGHAAQARSLSLVAQAANGSSEDEVDPEQDETLAGEEDSTDEAAISPEELADSAPEDDEAGPGALARCRSAAAAGAHDSALTACDEALAAGGLSVAEWVEVERLATRALFALGRRAQGERRLFALLVLDPALTLDDDAPDAMKAALGPATRRLLTEGRVEVEHSPPEDLKQLRHQPLTFVLTDPLARVAQAEALFEFVDGNETRGFAQVPLTRRSQPDGRSTWTGAAPPMAWPPRHVRYRLVLEGPARTAIEHALGPVTLKPSTALLEEEAAQRAEQARLSRETQERAKAVLEEEQAGPFPVALAAASTFTALTFGAAVVTVGLFGAVVVGNALANYGGLGLTAEQRGTLAWLSALSGIAGLLGIPAVFLLGAVSAGVWTYYGVAEVAE